MIHWDPHFSKPKTFTQKISMFERYFFEDLCWFAKYSNNLEKNFLVNFTRCIKVKLCFSLFDNENFSKNFSID